MEDKEDNFFQLSAIQHYLFCERQCYLIHAEQIWAENLFTAEGKILHERVDEQKAATHGDSLRVENGLLMRSLKLGISGKADSVEFHRKEDGSWIPFPVEYKRGKPKTNRCDEVQICAQAICLEEMLGVSIPEGALFYGKTRHRKSVVFDSELRRLTEEVCEKVRGLISRKTPPPALYEEEKCDNCSINEACMPKISGKSVTKYMSSLSSESSMSSNKGTLP